MKKESASLSEVLSRTYKIIRGRFLQLYFTCKVTSTRTGQLLNGSSIKKIITMDMSSTAALCAPSNSIALLTRRYTGRRNDQKRRWHVSFITQFACIHLWSAGISKVGRLVPKELRMLFY